MEKQKDPRQMGLGGLFRPPRPGKEFEFCSRCKGKSLEG